jgi:SAM-dependent methyltransferase
MHSSASNRPAVVDSEADAHFRGLVREIGRDPDDPWIGGYVDYEWAHGRHIYEAVPGSMIGSVLEFGCNYGATAIVLAALGADVTAVDVDETSLRIARANAARYGVGQRIRFVYCADSARLPFTDGMFQSIVCNSVLEYIEPHDLQQVQRELNRVLVPGGLLFVTGTSNRLWPRELHSRRWLVNYLPIFLDRILGVDWQRGVAPWSVRSGFGRYDNIDWTDQGRAYLDARARVSGSVARMALLRSANRLARLLGTSLGLLTPSISVTLRKKT